ncbi:MAG: porin [Betaproteobacteria bacterium]|nr:porin [Betaproteobacteria bacterium]
MQKKLLAVAVAGVLAAPAVALAQSSVTVSGVMNVWLETIKAPGSTVGGVAGGDIVSRSRMTDASGSNVRFAVVEDLGGGLSAIAQVESAVICGTDTRSNSITAGGAGTGVTNVPQASCGWGTRESFVGLNSKSVGAIRMGVLNIHYTEALGTEDYTTHTSTNHGLWSLYHNMGAGANLPNAGGRYANVVRYTSPTWGGFDFVTNWSRPTDGAPGNPPTAAGVGSVVPTGAQNLKDRIWQVGLRYNQGPINAGYSYFNDKDITMIGAFGSQIGTHIAGVFTGLGTAGAALQIRSDRLYGSYNFPMGFKVGLIWDRMRVSVGTTGAAATQGDARRTMWGIPMTYRTGAHELAMNYGKARNITGSNGAGQSVGGTGTGATMWSLGYSYWLSKRSSAYLGYQRITNGNNGTSAAGQGANYSFFANGAGNTNGSDPRAWLAGMYHSF